MQKKPKNFWIVLVIALVCAILALITIDNDVISTIFISIEFVCVAAILIVNRLTTEGKTTNIILAIIDLIACGALIALWVATPLGAFSAVLSLPLLAAFVIHIRNLIQGK